MPSIAATAAGVPASPNSEYFSRARRSTNMVVVTDVFVVLSTLLATQSIMALGAAAAAAYSATYGVFVCPTGTIPFKDDVCIAIDVRDMRLAFVEQVESNVDVHAYWVLEACMYVMGAGIVAMALLLAYKSLTKTFLVRTPSFAHDVVLGCVVATHLTTCFVAARMMHVDAAAMLFEIAAMFN